MSNKYKYKEKVILKGIPGVQMSLIGKLSDYDIELLKNDLDYDEELMTGIIYTNDSNFSNGYFLDDETNKWMIIREGKCKGSSDTFCNKRN
jgi:hypothetical protein